MDHVVAKATVTVDFTPVGEEAVHVIHGEWALRVAGQFSLLPGIDVQADLFTEKVNLMLEVLQLQSGFMVSGGAGFQQGNLPFNDFQLPLRFHCWIQRRLLANL
jgi:hypothetical protein